ncbi:hypothetical protein LWF15_35520 [Kineosporia rhizophila]|uniref:hypothetical protein n=1 Tax=Kineosporia TaxID=49184 RepID=UPI001E4E91E3|nr:MULTISPECIES: hypothetical protein [Kineosporia]MCE0540814.1 hypothetical protein [Kineosporia rhizophila]GLY18142.1 hypothetical protein Kisp01_51560 [Kineosporia sp. NBRC 101677]
MTYERDGDEAYLHLVDRADERESPAYQMFRLQGEAFLFFDLDKHGKVLGMRFELASTVLPQEVLDRAPQP